MKKRTVFLLLGALCLLAALGLTVWNLQTAGRAQIAAAAAVQQLEPLIAAPAQEAAQTQDEASTAMRPAAMTGRTEARFMRMDVSRLNSDEVCSGIIGNLKENRFSICNSPADS